MAMPSHSSVKQLVELYQQVKAESAKRPDVALVLEQLANNLRVLHNYEKHNLSNPNALENMEIRVSLGTQSSADAQYLQMLLETERILFAMRKFSPDEMAGIHNSLETNVPEYSAESIDDTIRKLPILKDFSHANSHANVPISDGLIQALVDEYKINKLIAQQAAKSKEKGKYFLLGRRYRQKKDEAQETCDKQVAKQYRKASLMVHPDRHGEAFVEDFDKLNMAYEILQGPRTRKEYVENMFHMVAGEHIPAVAAQAHNSLITAIIDREAQDTAQARYQKATTSNTTAHFYLEANVFQKPPKAIHINSKHDKTVHIALQPILQNASELLQSVSIFCSGDSEEEGDQLLKKLKGKALREDPENLTNGFINTQLTLPYGSYSIYWNATLKVDTSDTAAVVTTPNSACREILLENPKMVKARSQLNGFIHHATQLTSSLKKESRKLNSSSLDKPTAADLEQQFQRVQEIIANGRTLSNLLWRCLETLGYSYEEALAYGNGVLEEMLTWIDTCGREKSQLDDTMQVHKKKASLKSFQHSVGSLMEEGKLADWILRVQKEELVNTGAEVNRLYQLLTEGKKANSLWLDSASLLNASTRTDLFSAKQCQVLADRSSEVEAHMLEETQRLVAVKDKQEKEEKERLALERQAALGIGLHSTVVLHRLSNRADLNGSIGTYMGLAPDSMDRYIVRVGGIDMAFKETNFKEHTRAPAAKLFQCGVCTVVYEVNGATPSECGICGTSTTKTAKAAPPTKPAPKAAVSRGKGVKAAASVSIKGKGSTAKTAPKPTWASPKGLGQPALNLNWAAEQQNTKKSAPAPKPNAQQLQGMLTSTKSPKYNNKQQNAPVLSTKEPLPVRKTTMWIPESKVYFFMGNNKGSNVKAIQAESGARVWVHKHKKNDRGCCAVDLEGNPTQLLNAQICVERFLQEQKQEKDTVPSPSVPSTRSAPATKQTVKSPPKPPTTSLPKSADKEAMRMGAQTPTTVSVPDSISIGPPTAASGVTEVMEVDAPAVLPAQTPLAPQLSSPNAMDSLLLFLFQQKSCLKCKPGVFYEFLHGEDIESLQDLMEAANDEDFIQDMQSSGLKGFKKAAFKKAVAAAAKDTQVLGDVLTVDNGLTKKASASNQQSQIHFELECPICFELMVTDPVTASDGYTYERHAIENWFELHKGSPNTIRSPKTNLPMQGLNLVANKSMLAMARGAAARA